MSYTPTAGDVVGVAFATGYTAPAGDLVPLSLRDPDPVPPAPVRYVGAAVGVRWSIQPARPRVVRAAHRQAPERCQSPALNWQRAPGRREGVFAAWGRVPGRGVAVSLPWGRPGVLPSILVSVPWRQIPVVCAARGMSWDWPPSAACSSSIAWTWPSARPAATELPWDMPPTVRRAAGMRWTCPPAAIRRWYLPWGYGRAVRWVVHGPGVEPPTEPPGTAYVAPAGDVVGVHFICPLVAFDGDVAPVPLGLAACYLAWPKERTYIVLNSAHVVRLPERTPIAVRSIQIRGSVDDVVWTFSIELGDPAHLAYLLKDADGPRAIEINVNGYVWTAIVDARRENRRHPGRTVGVTARSRTAVLDAPYAPIRSHVQPAERQAQQLVDEELTLTGFSADYDTLTWLVPGGTWHYDSRTPMEAVRSIAASAGAVVQSHPWDVSIAVRPRYPVSPWSWPATAADKQIADDVILSIEARNQSRPLYDYVLVSGEQVGVSDPIIRAGSAGEVRAPMVVDALITEHSVALERGRNVLSDRGEQDIVDIVLPLFPASDVGRPGLIYPLDLVEVIEPAAWKGLAQSVEINVDTSADGVLTVEQTVGIARHYSDAN